MKFVVKYISFTLLYLANDVSYYLKLILYIILCIVTATKEIIKTKLLFLAIVIFITVYLFIAAYLIII